MAGECGLGGLGIVCFGVGTGAESNTTGFTMDHGNNGCLAGFSVVLHRPRGHAQQLEPALVVSLALARPRAAGGFAPMETQGGPSDGHYGRSRSGTQFGSPRVEHASFSSGSPSSGTGCGPVL